MYIEVEVLPVYLYEQGTELRLLSSSGAWEHYVVCEPPPPIDSETAPARRLEPGAASTYNLMPIGASVGASLAAPSPPPHHPADGRDGREAANGKRGKEAGRAEGREVREIREMREGRETCISVELTKLNHALVLDPGVDMRAEYLKYAGWIRSTYSFVVDALSGERLDIMLQCVKLRVEGASTLMHAHAQPHESPSSLASSLAPSTAYARVEALLHQREASASQRDAFDIVMREVEADARGTPVLVVGEAASGKSTFARLFLMQCIQQQAASQLVPFLITTIDLVRVIKQNDLGADYLDGYLRSVYGPNSRRYLFLKQAMMERRLVLFLDGMDEVPTGLKSMFEAYVMCYLRTCARVVMTSRPGGFSQAWLEQCVTMRIVPLDAQQKESVAQARLKQEEHLTMFQGLMARPDLQQLASNPLILSMVLSYIRSATSAVQQAAGPLNRWRLYHSAMSTIITRLDAKTLEARKGQAGRSGDEYMLLLQGIAYRAHCKQLKDLNAEVLRAAISGQTSALWDDVKESVARGQFAVLTFFVENDETIYRFGHLTFQEHLCSMVINRMMSDEMDRVKATMTSSGGIKKMLQGSWWLTVTQFCIEGLMVEGDKGEAMANRFAETMLEDVIDKEGVLKLGHKELHSFDGMSAFAALLKHAYNMSALELGDGKSDISAEWLSQLCGALAGHPSLRRLALRRMSFHHSSQEVCDTGLRCLSAVLRDSQVLEVLQLQACGLESRHIVPLCAELSGAPIRLKELDLSANKIADAGLMALARVFAIDGVTLEMLDISGNALEEGGVAALAKALSASSGLKTVKLASHPLPIQALKTGARVSMDGQKLTDFDVQFMATVLSASRPGDAHEVAAIPGMSLACNALTDKGASMLASALGSGGLRLLELNLRGNKIGREGVLSLVDAATRVGCPLALLDVSDNGICGLNADGDGTYSDQAVLALCAWLRRPGNPLRGLKLGQNQLCGVNWKGRGKYTSAAVEALCDALGREECRLSELKIFGNCWGNADTYKLAAALRLRRVPLRVLDIRWNEMGGDACDCLLAAATPLCVVEHAPQRLRCGATLNAHTNWVETLQHDDQYMYSGSQDMSIRKWRRSDLHCEATLRGHEKGVLSLKLLGDMLYAGDRKGEIKLWKVGPEGAEDIYQCKGTLTGHKGAIWMLQYDEEVRRLYSCCDDKKVISWDVIHLKPVKVFDGHKDKVYREALYLEGRASPDGGLFFSGDSTGTIYEWDIATKTLSHSWHGHEGSVWGMLMASFALITGGLDGMVKLWDPRTRALQRQLYRHNQSVCSFSVQGNVFYSCAVDNIIKVWDWKDGTCLGTMHGHRETVANLCLSASGTLFSSGIDKMVKVWKPPGSWGEEWHGLQELDLTTAGMVAEDVDRLEKQLRGEQAKWASLSVSNNCLYDEGIAKLVRVLLKTTAPLETLDLSKTCMSSFGVKLVAELLVPDGEGRLLPLKKLVLHGNSIGPDGYAAIGAAMLHPRCGLREFVVSTQIKEKKTGQNRVSKTEEHNCVQVAEVRSMAVLCVDFFADPELIILSEVLLLNTTLHAIELRKNKVGDDGVEALSRAVGRGNLPVKTVHLEGNQLSSMGATLLVRGLMQGGCPLEELVIADNAITVSAEAVRRRKAEGEREVELRKVAAVSRATPASEWARAQLHVRAVVADRTRQGAPRTSLSQADFAALLALPKELREDRWEELGGL